MADKTYALDFTIHDPKTGTDSVKTVTFTVPQGPKGDSRGVSAKRVATMQEFSSLYKALTDTQQIIGMVAFTDSTGIPIRQSYASLHVIDDVIRYSLVLQDNSSGTELTTVDFSIDVETGPFKISSGSSLIDADYVDVYIYDSDDTPTGPMYLDLSGEADYQLYQGIMAGYNWAWNSLNPPALSTVSQIEGSFNYRAQDLEAGKSYLALFSGVDTDGLRASVFTVGSDGTSVTWDAGKRWEIPLGTQIRMPNGAIYIAVAKPTVINTPIYDCVKPISGKIPLEIEGLANNTYFNNLRNVDVKFKISSDVGKPSQATVFINDCSDCDYHVDCSNLGVDGSDRTTLILYLDDKNTAIPAGSQFLGDNVYNSSYPGIQKYKVYNGSWNAETINPQSVPFADTPTILKTTVTRFYQNFVVREAAWKFSNGDRIRRDLAISLIGYSPVVTRPIVYEDAASTASLMAAPAKAMALSLSAEPGMSQEEFSKIIEGKKGIFTVKDGMAYNLLTGEYLM